MDEARAAVVTVGNELLHGERQNDNERWLLGRLARAGMPAAIALVLPDDAVRIGAAIRWLTEGGHAPILVSGGIGGTHDDLTRQGVAAGLGLALEIHPDCDTLLRTCYGDDYTPQRRRMAELPAGCDLIPNPLGAPGFRCGDLFAFPGFPNMLRPMVETVLERLPQAAGARPLLSREYVLPVMEGAIAAPVEAFSLAHPEVSIGLYPSAAKLRREVTVRLRYPEEEAATAEAFDELMAALRERL